ncbi:MAG TPA: adenylate/guanylate cyclase domain-containing protein [Acidimicrobiia bacterium]|nr:adenylate/guanylate cyclase domain-containing protein [Acidimicrobiia bacterium]
MPSAVASLMASTMVPVLGQFFDRLASFARLIRLDKRGVGMSDPIRAGGAPPLEQQVGDVLAVMDAVGSNRAALYGGGASGHVALLFAAMHPDRVTALILDNTFARYFAADDYPWGAPVETREHLLQQVRERWGDLDHPWGLHAFAPSRAPEADYAREFGRVQQVSASKSAAVAEYQAYHDTDLRDVLPLVQAPTLITFPEGLPFLNDAGRYLAEHIPDARVVARPGADIFLSPDRAGGLGATIEEFLTGVRPAVTSDRVLAAVLFTDIVTSTERVAELGDRAWRDLLDRYRAVVRDELRRFHGREINTRGDDFLTTFDGPARAIHCAFAINNAVEKLGLSVRSGLHTGEIELMANDIGGIAVHIGARVCSLAGPGEVLVTSTVRDLVAGSGLNFVEQGRHTLRGVPGEWTILSVQP